MALDLECKQKMVEKSSMQEELKVEQNFLHSTLKTIKNTSEFRSISSTGNSVVGKYLLILYKEKKYNNIRFGFTITKKIGNAVKRNRIKRLLKAVIHQYNLSNNKYDYILIARHKINFADFNKINKEFSYLINKIDNENNNKIINKIL